MNKIRSCQFIFSINKIEDCLLEQPSKQLIAKISKILSKKSFSAFFKKFYNLGPKGCEKLGKILFLIKDLQFLSVSFKKDNKIDNEGLIEFSQSLLLLKELKQLKIIVCKDNQINSVGISRFSHHLSQILNLEKFSIKIYNHSIEKEGLDNLTSSISSLTKLNSLTIKLIKNEINGQSINYLSSKLSLLPLIKKLKLSFVNQKDDIQDILYGLIQDLSSLQNLDYLKLEVISKQFRKLNPSVNLSQILKKIKGIKTLYLNIPLLEQEELLTEVYDQQNILKLEVLYIFFNHSLQKEDFSLFSNTFKYLSNLKNLTINIQTDKLKYILSVDKIDDLLGKIEKCKQLQSLSINSETGYDYKFLRLIQSLKYITTISLFKNQIIEFNRDEINNDVIKLIIPFKTFSQRQTEQLQYLIESLHFFDKLQTLLINFLDIEFITFEKKYQDVSYYDTTLKRDIKDSIKQIRLSLQEQINHLMLYISNNKNIVFFKIQMLIENQNYIQGQRIQNTENFFIENYIEPQLLFTTQLMMKLSQNITKINVKIQYWKPITNTYILILGTVFRQSHNLKFVDITYDCYYNYEPKQQLMDQLFIHLKQLRYYRQNPRMYLPISKQDSRQLIKNNIRLVSYK